MAAGASHVAEGPRSMHPEVDAAAAMISHKRVVATSPSQHNPQSAFLLTAFSSAEQQLRNFHTSTSHHTAEGKEQKDIMEKASKLDPVDPDQPVGTAKVSFVEGIEDDALHAPNMPQTDEQIPKHPIEHLKGEPSDYTVPIVIKMPDVLDSDEEHNTIEKWYKEPGDVIKPNDLLCDIATPAFTFGMVTEDEEDAIMGEIHVPEGDMARDDAAICTIYHMPDEKSEESEPTES